VAVHKNSLANLKRGGIDKKHQFTAGPEGTAVQAANTRWERAREAAAEGLKDALDKRGTGESVEQAWKEIVKNQAELAADPEKRGSTQAARLVGQAADLLPRANQQPESSGPATVIQIDARDAQILLAQINDKKE
tara:strand:- start:755 stop:1159 length:405 start_codon:yes stop_codon:yes gene_type:complete